MRPRQEVRAVLAEAFPRVCAQVGPVTVDFIARETQVGFDVAMVTIRNMVVAGELVKVGKHKPAGSSRWHSLYEPPGEDDIPQPWGGIEALADVMRQFPATQA